MSLLKVKLGGNEKLVKYHQSKIKLNLDITRDGDGNSYGLTLDSSNGLKLIKDKDLGIGFKIANPHFESYNKVEFQFKFNKSSNTTFPQIIGEVGSYWKQPNIWFTGNTGLNVGIPSGTDSWVNAFFYNGIVNNSWYTVWFEIDNITNLCKFKLYDNQGVLLTSREKMFDNIEYRSVDYIGFLFGTDTLHNFVGELDLEKCYIKCDGNLVWGIG